MQRHALPAIITVGALATYAAGGRREYLLILALIASLSLAKELSRHGSTKGDGRLPNGPAPSAPRTAELPRPSGRHTSRSDEPRNRPDTSPAHQYGTPTRSNQGTAPGPAPPVPNAPTSRQTDKPR